MSSGQTQYLKLNPYLEITGGINAVLTFSEGLIKVTGSKGSGKSSVCHLLVDELKEEELEVVLFSKNPESSQEIEKYIQQQLSLEKHVDFIPSLTRHIAEHPPHQQKLILIFDDAEMLSDDVFQTIIQLADIKHNFTLLISIVLCGTEALNKKLNEADKASILEKVILSLDIGPMDLGELKEFCSAYMLKMGLSKHTLSEEDYSQISEGSKGYPGRVAELIYEVLDQEVSEKAPEENKEAEKSLIGKLVELDNDTEPELAGLSVADREQVLMEFKEQVPWRWQSNGVAIAVVVILAVVVYGWFGPATSQQSTPRMAVVEEARVLGDIVITEDEITDLSPAVEEAIPVLDEIEDEQDFAATDTEESLVTEEPAPAIPVPVEDINVELAVEEVTEEEISEEEIIETELVQADIATVEEEPVEESLQRRSTREAIDQSLFEPKSFIDEWIGAWEDQNVEQYFLHYQDGFIPSYHASLSTWRGDRQTKISRPKFIEIDVEGLELVDNSIKGLTVRFWLSYVSSYYKDRTLKEVLLTENSFGELLIKQERNLEVEIIPYYP